MRLLFFILFFLVCSDVRVLSENQPFKLRPDLDVYYLKKGQEVSSVSSKPYVPASVVKLFTAAHALFSFGAAHHFETNIYVTKNGQIGVKGSGDPGMTSEVLFRCVDEFSKQVGARKVYTEIILDNTKYLSDINIPGQGGSSNPYDAPVTAIGINFNSVSLKVQGALIESGEPQTPLTPYAKSLARGLKNGSHRISLKGSDSAERQFSEVLLHFLGKYGIKVKNGFVVSDIPEDATLVVSCRSQTLEELLSGMLKYSNNFSANQLFLNSGAVYFGYPVSLDKSRKAMSKFIREELGISEPIVIEEGAGLSRSNRFSPRDTVILLKYFEPYRNLLPESQGVYYKSGTLTGVSNLAGYVTKDDNVVGYFALYGNMFRPIEERVSVMSSFKNK